MGWLKRADRAIAIGNNTMGWSERPGSMARLRLALVFILPGILHSVKTTGPAIGRLFPLLIYFFRPTHFYLFLLKTLVFIWMKGFPPVPSPPSITADRKAIAQSHRRFPIAPFVSPLRLRSLRFIPRRWSGPQIDGLRSIASQTFKSHEFLFDSRLTIPDWLSAVDLLSAFEDPTILIPSDHKYCCHFKTRRFVSHRWFDPSIKSLAAVSKPADSFPTVDLILRSTVIAQSLGLSRSHNRIGFFQLHSFFLPLDCRSPDPFSVVDLNLRSTAHA